MDKQLICVTKILEENGINYWLEFGTLLGLIRDDKIIEKKNDFDDIDLGIFVRDESKLKKIIPVFKNLGYICKRISLDGKTFKYKLFPKKIEKGAVCVDILLFRETDEYYYGPIMHIINPYPAKSLKGQLLRMKIIFFNSWVKLRYHKENHPSYEKLPVRGLFKNIFSYAVAVRDKNSLDNLVKDPKYGYNIPDDVDTYLSCIYGEWKIPVSNYSFWEEEKALEKMSRKNLLELLEKN